MYKEFLLPSITIFFPNSPKIFCPLYQAHSKPQLLLISNARLYAKQISSPISPSPRKKTTNETSIRETSETFYPYEQKVRTRERGDTNVETSLTRRGCRSRRINQRSPGAYLCRCDARASARGRSC